MRKYRKCMCYLMSDEFNLLFSDNSECQMK